MRRPVAAALLLLTLSFGALLNEAAATQVLIANSTSCPGKTACPAGQYYDCRWQGCFCNSYMDYRPNSNDPTTCVPTCPLATNPSVPDTAQAGFYYPKTCPTQNGIPVFKCRCLDGRMRIVNGACVLPPPSAPSCPEQTTCPTGQYYDCRFKGCFCNSYMGYLPDANDPTKCVPTCPLATDPTQPDPEQGGFYYPRTCPTPHDISPSTPVYVCRCLDGRKQIVNGACVIPSPSPPPTASPPPPAASPPPPTASPPPPTISTSPPPPAPNSCASIGSSCSASKVCCANSICTNIVNGAGRCKLLLGASQCPYAGDFNKACIATGLLPTIATCDNLVCKTVCNLFCNDLLVYTASDCVSSTSGNCQGVISFLNDLLPVPLTGGPCCGCKQCKSILG